jgi:hypothetical protein
MRIRQAAKQDSIHDAENRSRRSNSQRQCQHRGDREARPSHQSAYRESQVLHCNIQEWQSALLAIDFLGLFHATEFAMRGGSRFLRRHSPANVFFRERAQVFTQFFLKVRIQPPFVDESPYSRHKSADNVHQALPLPASIPVITAAIRSHREVSVARCRRPAAVNE